MGFRPTDRPTDIRPSVKRRGRKSRYMLILLTVTLFLVTVGIPQLRQDQSTPDRDAFPIPRPGRGTLQFSAYKRHDNTTTPLRHTSVFVNGADYTSMEDNDLRGFLDGVFKYGWNQSGQIHVRVGRRQSAPRYGEHELFRVLHRWGDIELPPAAEIIGARLAMMVEKGPAFDVSVLLYEVKKDWLPGEGGTQHNNTSPPQKGEVWWNDVAYMEKSWGLPGAGFASDHDPDADTGAMPLAEAHYHPGSQKLIFSSPKLTHYLSQRIRAHQPALFLLKLSDYHEDRLASVLTLYSGNYGDSRNLQRRPHLYLKWESRTEAAHFTKDIFLEYGRSYTLPRQDTNGAQHVAVSFQAASGYPPPTIEICGGKGENVSPWRQVSHPFVADWEWIQIRLSAVADPVVMGQAFVAQLRDTWVVTRPPETQDVLWTFISPTSKAYRVSAVYQSDYLWQVHFQPEELGRWHYYWTQNFTKGGPHKSALGTFDVIAGDRKNIKRQLHRLQDRIQHTSIKHPERLIERFETDFVKLERAALQLETPKSFTSKSQDDVYTLLKQLRVLLWGEGKPLPEPIPLQADHRKW